MASQWQETVKYLNDTPSADWVNGVLYVRSKECDYEVASIVHYDAGAVLSDGLNDSTPIEEIDFCSNEESWEEFYEAHYDVEEGDYIVIHTVKAATLCADNDTKEVYSYENHSFDTPEVYIYLGGKFHYLQCGF